MSKRDDLIVDLLLKIGTDPATPIERKIEVALALHKDKMSRDLSRHEIALEKAKRAPIKRNTIRRESEPENIVEQKPVDSRPLGDQAAEAIRVYEESLREENKNAPSNEQTSATEAS